MSVGNIAPRTASITLTGMLLGSEVYPSVVSQADMQNFGYAIYSPVRAHEAHGGTALATSGVGTASVTTANIYLNAGNRDIELKLTADASGSGNVWLEVGGVHVSSVHTVSSGTTIIESFAGASLSAGWNSVKVYAYDSGASGVEIYEVDSFLRQYT